VAKSAIARSAERLAERDGVGAPPATRFRQRQQAAQRTDAGDGRSVRALLSNESSSCCCTAIPSRDGAARTIESPLPAYTPYPPPARDLRQDRPHRFCRPWSTNGKAEGVYTSGSQSCRCDRRFHALHRRGADLELSRDLAHPLPRHERSADLGLDRVPLLDGPAASHSLRRAPGPR
jgi:hypothetical protein